MKKIRAAKYILQCYRRYKLREYIHHLKRIGEETRSLYLHNRSVSPTQKAHLENWPTPPKTLVNVVAILLRIYRRWKAWLLLRHIPKEQWPEYRLKIIAISALSNKRHNYGLNENWKGNYLAIGEFNLNSNQFTNSIHRSLGDQKILFSSRICKASTGFFKKSSDRLIVVTRSHIYKLDPVTFKLLNKGFPICDVSGIGLSRDNNQLVAVRVRGGNDLIMALVDTSDVNKPVNRVGEFVAIILQQYSM